jgi:hypothetical protein
MEGHMATKQTAAVAAKTGTIKVPATAAVTKQTGALSNPPKDAPPKPPSKFTALVTVDGTAKRFHVSEYQDYTFSINATRKLTDVELAADWRKVFPNAVTYTEFHVQGARRDFCGGRHSKEYRGRTFSLPEFIIADGKRVAVTELPKPAPKAAPAALKATPAAPVVKAAPVAKAKGMVIKTNRAKAA